jgi:beta-carotene 15,15'-dioxygenase
MPSFFEKIHKLPPTWCSVLIGIALLLLQYWQGGLSENTQLFIFVFLILSTGIPHGALDHLIQKRTDEKSSKKHNFMLFLVKYIGIMLVYLSLWLMSPSLGLLLFLVISAWHFGETDVEKAPQQHLVWTATRLVYGFGILLILFLSHAQEIDPGIKRMMGNQENGMMVWSWISQNTSIVLGLIFLLFIVLFLSAQKSFFVPFDKNRILRLGLIVLLSLKLPFLVAFALYFGGWHAFCAFDNIHIYLKKGYPNLSFRFVYIQSLPFTALAVVFLGAFLYYCAHFTQHHDPYVVLFIFISIITLPHLVIANQMNHGILD